MRLDYLQRVESIHSFITKFRPEGKFQDFMIIQLLLDKFLREIYTLEVYLAGILEAHLKGKFLYQTVE